jgi:hypothetical protein
MQGRSTFHAGLVAVLGYSFAPAVDAQGSGAHARPAVAPPLQLALTKTPVAKATLRPGWRVAAALPAEAFRVKMGEVTLRFLDLNQDGKLAVGTDGMALGDAPFVVPIVGELLLHDAQYRVEFDGTASLRLTPVDLGEARDLVADASVLTEMRVRAGLAPFALDAKRCEECRKHCDYAVRNGTWDGSQGISIHHEDAGKPGYTPEGAAAGEASDLLPGPPSLRDALVTFHATVWHGVPIFDPEVARVGVALVDRKLAMLSFVDQKSPRADFIHPADGATGIPCAFSSHGEAPNPVPGTGNAENCGFPVLVRLSGKLGELEWAELLDPKGRKVTGTFSSPEHPATPDWPSNSDCAAFIPSMSLLPATTYRARFKFKAAAEPLVTSFTTRGKR